MPVGTLRDKVLYGIGRKRGRMHRYTFVRWAVGLVFTALIAWLPLSGTLRFDLWGGRHMWLGEEVDFVTVAKAFAFPFLGVNVAIILASRFFGRYLCGFVCPYGALARFREWFRFRARTRRARLGGGLALFGVCALLSAIVFSFWVDWRVFVAGSPVARALSGLFLGGMTGSFFLFLYLLGLRFCREWCPSGVYFALLGQETMNGVEFAHPENCTECGACEKVCPMDLKPKDMGAEKPRGGMGLYGDALSNWALCIRCGDCVNACEGVVEEPGVALPLRMGFLSPAARGEQGELEEAAR